MAACLLSIFTRAKSPRQIFQKPLLYGCPSNLSTFSTLAGDEQDSFLERLGFSFSDHPLFLVKTCFCELPHLSSSSLCRFLNIFSQWLSGTNIDGVLGDLESHDMLWLLLTICSLWTKAPVDKESSRSINFQSQHLL